jgi:aminoglycoside/choline kinase family phosphotransferase
LLVIDQMLFTPWVRSRPVAGDASTRCYARVWDEAARTAILVRYPEAIRAQLQRDVAVWSWCGAQGLRVPAVIDCDQDRGWAVLEDLGEADAEATLRQTAVAARVDVGALLLKPLTTLAGIEPRRLPSWNPPLDGERLRWELAGFELWYVRHRCNRRPGPSLGRWLDELALEIAGHPQRVCHRDYHLNNLFLLADGEVGLIDTQDVLRGPDTYDISSLLNERAMPELLGSSARSELELIWAEQTGADAGWKERRLQVRLQRALKVLGTFARLEASGRRVYSTWLRNLAGQLAGEPGSGALPDELRGLLLDC